MRRVLTSAVADDRSKPGQPCAQSGIIWELNFSMRENVSLCGFPVFTRIVPDVNLLTSKGVEKITILDRCSSASMTLQCFCLRKGIPRRCPDEGPVAVGRYSQSSKHVSVALTPRSPGLPAVRQAKKRWRRYVCPATFETIVQHFFFLFGI